VKIFTIEVNGKIFHSLFTFLF